MLREWKAVRQHRGEAWRRWFHGEGVDLITWQDADGQVVEFELNYQLDGVQRAFRWRRGGSCNHLSVDDGERHPLVAKMTPVLVPDGELQAERVLRLLQGSDAVLGEELLTLVQEKLRSFARAPA